MNTAPNTQKKGHSIGFILTCVVCAVLTAVCAVFAVLQFMKPEDGEDYSRYWQQLDAGILAATVESVYPDERCAYANGEFITELDDGTVDPMSWRLNTARIQEGNRDGDQLVQRLSSGLIENVFNREDVMKAYGNHLRTLSGKTPTVLEKDMDADGKVEYVYLIDGFANAWLDTLPASAVKESYQPLYDKTTCLFIDVDDSGRLFSHCAVVDKSAVLFTDARWHNGMLHLMYTENEISGVCRVFGTNANNAEAIYEVGASKLRTLCSQYTTYLEDRGYTDIHMRLTDVSVAPGKEVLCCYSNGKIYTSVVLFPYCGTLLELYRCESDDGAVFLTDYNSLPHLMFYSQSIDSNYRQTYSMELFRLDDTATPVLTDQREITIAADESGNHATRQFFQLVNQYLASSDVCYDPYELTGYKVMQDDTDDDESLQPTINYLRITNCDTNKSGFVQLQNDDSWLNFRQGPSVKHKRVLIDPDNPHSIVRQVQHSPVTVLMPENVDNEENPIWVKIRISYANHVLEGYSSQRYIRIDGIRHLQVGETFDIEAESSAPNLTWKCSDTSVATIDSATGVLTAKKSGLVLITVTADGGLQDSCLIMIEGGAY